MVIQIENLRRQFGQFTALQGLNLDVPEGSTFVLIGPNGAGKSTTINILMNIIEPTQGTATVLGINSRKMSPEVLARIGYVSENQKMPGRMTVGSYIEYLRPFYPTWDRALEAEILGQLDLPPDRKIKDLSHGMRLKMALACALPFRPKLLVLDEPLSGLDPLVRDEFMQSLLHQTGERTVLISSHELAEIEGIATHVAFLDKGQVSFQDSMAALNARLRAIRVIASSEIRIPTSTPEEWLDIRVSGHIMTFVDTRYDEATFRHRLVGLLPDVMEVETKPVALRSIFTTLARATKKGRA